MKMRYFSVSVAFWIILALCVATCTLNLIHGSQEARVLIDAVYVLEYPSYLFCYIGVVYVREREAQ